MIYSPYQLVYVAPPKLVGTEEFVDRTWKILEGERCLSVPAGLSGVAAAAVKRNFLPPDNVTVDSPHMIDELVCILESDSPSAFRSAHMHIYDRARDAGDRAISPETFKTIVATLIEPSDATQADLVNWLGTLDGSFPHPERWRRGFAWWGSGGKSAFLNPNTPIWIRFTLISNKAMTRADAGQQSGASTTNLTTARISAWLTKTTMRGNTPRTRRSNSGAAILSTRTFQISSSRR